MTQKEFTPPHELLGMSNVSSVLVAFSGGPDSAALLDMLVRYGKETGARIYAAHVDHLIRQDEHGRDRDFCIKTAKKYGIELFLKTADIPALSKETGESTELCARRFRYEFFDELMREHDIPILATAHNADDNLETLLMSLIRGSGLRGMGGIPPVRKTAFGVLVRPLLSMSKDEILGYCRENGIEFVTDSTNAIPDCTRNRLRLEVIPILKEINAAALKNATKLSRLCREDEELLMSMSDLVKDGGIDAKEFMSSPAPLRARALFCLFGSELEAVHIEALTRLCEASVPHSELSLPERKTAVIENGKLILKEEFSACEPYEMPLSKGRNLLPNRHLIYIGDTDHSDCIDKALIASEKATGKLTVRNRREGDKILLKGHHRSVKKLMNEKKLPLSLRASLPIVCDSQGIVFIPYIGLRDGMSAEISENKTYITYLQG